MTTNQNPNPDNTAAPVVECVYCVEGFRPSNIDPYMGPLYHGCLHCGTACPTCNGDGVFPAAPADLVDFTAQCNAQGWAPILCPACLGVTVLVELQPGDTGP